MKSTILCLCLTLLLRISGNAQSAAASTTINFFNQSTVYRAFIIVGPQRKDRVTIEPNTWIVVHPKNDALPVFINGKVFSMHFESGKTYYYFITGGSASTNGVAERSEQEFLFSAANPNLKGPFDYDWPTPTDK